MFAEMMIARSPSDHRNDTALYVVTRMKPIQAIPNRIHWFKEGSSRISSQPRKEQNPVVKWKKGTFLEQNSSWWHIGHCLKGLNAAYNSNPPHRTPVAGDGLTDMHIFAFQNQCRTHPRLGSKSKNVVFFQSWAAYCQAVQILLCIFFHNCKCFFFSNGGSMFFEGLLLG